MALEYLTQPVLRPITPDYDLNEVVKTYDMLQQRHDTAVIQESALKKAIGELQFNAEEDEFKQMLINDTMSKVSQAMVGDFKGYALDEIIAEQGNLLSNPAVISRLRSQQAYKAYQDNLDKRTDISEDKKEYFREMNHYYHEDKYDSAGNVIGGSEWKPIKQEVSEVPKSAIMNQALQWAAKETGSSNNAYFLDANGKPTPYYEESVDGNIFMYQNGSYQKLSKEKLRQAVNAAIDMTPGARASFEQDYEIALWKDGKSENGNPDVRDNNGQLMSYTEYTNKGFDAAIDAASYYNFTSNIEFGDALKARREAQKTAAQNQLQSNQRVLDLIQSNSNLEVVQNTTPSDLTTAIASTKQNLTNILQTNVDGKSTDELRNMVMTLQNPVEKYELLNQIDELEIAESNLNRLKNTMTPSQQESFDFINAIDSGVVLPQNSITKEYNDIINTLFPSNAKGFAFSFNRDTELQTFITNIGGVENIKKLGATLTKRNGKDIVYIPRESRNNIYDIAVAYKQANDKEGNFFLNRFTDRAYYITDKDGEVDAVASKNEAFLSRDIYNVAANDLLNFVDKQRNITNESLELNSVPMQTQFVPVGTVAELEARMMLASGIGDHALLTKQIEDQQDLIRSSIAGTDLTQQNTRVWNEDTNGYYTKLTSEDLMKYNALLVNDKVKKEYAMSFDINGEPDVIVSMLDEDNKPIRLKIGGIDDAITRDWKKQTDIKAKSDIIKLINFDKDIALTNNTSFANIDKISLDKNLVLSNVATKQSKQLTQKEAIDLRDAYLIWTQTANTVMSGVNNPEGVAAISLKVAETYANIVYGTNNQNTINGIALRLRKNIDM